MINRRRGPECICFKEDDDELSPLTILTFKIATGLYSDKSVLQEQIEAKKVALTDLESCKVKKKKTLLANDLGSSAGISAYLYPRVGPIELPQRLLPMQVPGIDASLRIFAYAPPSFISSLYGIFLASPLQLHTLLAIHTSSGTSSEHER